MIMTAALAHRDVPTGLYLFAFRVILPIFLYRLVIKDS